MDAVEWAVVGGMVVLKSGDGQLATTVRNSAGQAR